MTEHSAFSYQRSAKASFHLAVWMGILWLAAPFCAFAFDGNNLEQELRAKYQGQTVMLRDFYCGKNLRFDAQAKLLSGGWSGPWTLCRDIRISDVAVKDKRIRFKGQRIYLVYDSQQKRFFDVSGAMIKNRYGKKPEIKAEKVSIEMDLDSSLDNGTLSGAVARLFYPSEEEFTTAAPLFWRKWLSGSQDAGPSTPAPRQKLSPHSSEADHRTAPGQALPAATEGAEGGILRVGNGVKAPVVVYSPDPDYSDEGRKALIEGTLAMNVVIGPDGLTHNPSIVRPMGMGFDEKALAKVLTWKFKPALKDGKPVAVEVTVEVSFNLY